MIFSSYEFLITLGAMLAGYWVWGKFAQFLGWGHGATWYLAFISLYFYAYWGWADLSVLSASLGVNFLAGRLLVRPGLPRRRWVCFAAVGLNLGALAYFKYSAFFTDLIAVVTGPWAAADVFLPLGISFFTFQQIGYVVDCYRGKGGAYGFIDYLGFVTFFPQLIAGPIVSHRALVPQMKRDPFSLCSWENMARGLAMFGFGLCKKTCLADQLAPFVDAGYAHAAHLSAPEAWIVLLSYTCQLYFDFSGYSDMAVGLGLMFGVCLPFNFDSPLKSTSIGEFWTRWNITLGIFFRDYFFRAIGGFRRSTGRQYFALFLTMFMVGVWHGGTWLFALWGGAHGLAVVIARFWNRRQWFNPDWFGWITTFSFVTLSLVFFEAPEWPQLWSMYRSVFAGGLVLPHQFAPWASWLGGLETRVWFEYYYQVPKEVVLLLLAGALALILGARNTNAVAQGAPLSGWLLAKAVVAFVMGAVFISGGKEFIYFVF